MQLRCSPLSEYTYYENALLGLPKTLRKCPGVTQMYLKKLPAVSSAEILQWETTSGVKLPEQMKKFYLASNGYSFKYKYVLSGDATNEIALGCIYINPLDQLKQVYGYETTNDSGIKFDGERYAIRLAPQSKVFELDLLPDRGKVAIIYLFPEFPPTIWLLTVTMGFYFLADDISTYLRMCVAHLGIPNWQFAYTPLGIPQWTENMFRMLAPHLLPLKTKLQRKLKSSAIVDDNAFPNEPVNCLDKNIFYMLPLRPPPAPVAPPMPCIPAPLPQKLTSETSKEVLKTEESSSLKLRKIMRKPFRRKKIKLKKISH